MPKLYPYQREGAEWLASKEQALLADEPGLGKTAQLVLACDLVKAEQILVIPPASVRSVWKREIDVWSMFGHEVNLLTSSNELPKRGCVNVINYDLLARGFKKDSYKHDHFMKRILDIHWDVTIADEAHYLKDTNSLRGRAVLAANGIHGKSDRLWLATGTPMPNHPGELWGIMVACGAIDMEYKDFIDRYCEMGQFGYAKGQPKGAKDETADELNRILEEKMMLRRYKKFVMPQLPPIRVDDMPVPEVKIKVEQFFEDAFADKMAVTRKIKAEEDFVTQVWQRAIASEGTVDLMDMIKTLEGVGPSVALYRRWLGACKAVSFTPILLDELKTGAVQKVVVFAHHRQVIKYLKAQLEDYNPVAIDGSTQARVREKSVEEFQNNPACRVFIGQNIAAGTGITLTAAHEVVMLEPDWVPANNSQAIMRCHRIGQKNMVRARFVRLADTLDDYISETLARKTRDIVRIVGS